MQGPQQQAAGLANQPGDGAARPVSISPGPQPLVLSPRTLDLVMFGPQQQLSLPEGSGSDVFQRHISTGMLPSPRRAESTNGGIQAPTGTPTLPREQHQAEIFLQENGLSRSDAFAVCSALGAFTMHDLWMLKEDATGKVASATDLPPIELAKLKAVLAQLKRRVTHT